MEQMSTTEQRSFEENLEQLEEVLKSEYRALLDGDASTVSALALEKERLSDVLSAAPDNRTDASQFSEDVKRLAARVKESVALNHMLLQQMYQHYHGMLELFMRIGGQSRTYGKNGMISIETPPEKRGEILA